MKLRFRGGARRRPEREEDGRKGKGSSSSRKLTDAEGKVGREVRKGGAGGNRHKVQICLEACRQMYKNTKASYLKALSKNSCSDLVEEGVCICGDTAVFIRS